MTVISYGLMLHFCLMAAEQVAQEGLSVEVLDLRTVKPLDRPAIVSSVQKTGKALIVHEDNLTGGVGAEVAAIIAEDAFDSLDAPVMRLCGPDVPAMGFAPTLEDEFMPNPEKIANALRKIGRILARGEGFAMTMTTIDLPQVGESVTEGTIQKWLKKPGDKISKYDPLVEVETDKVTMEVPSPVNGVMGTIPGAGGLDHSHGRPNLRNGDGGGRAFCRSRIP